MAGLVIRYWTALNNNLLNLITLNILFTQFSQRNQRLNLVQGQRIKQYLGNFRMIERILIEAEAADQLLVPLLRGVNVFSNLVQSLFERTLCDS